MLAVRWLHVLAMAVVLGGATTTWWQFRRAETAGAALATAGGYEWAFWAAVGVLVMTGVGNLGSLAPYVPAAGTTWGTAFAAKLAAVLAVLVLSVVRTLVVHRCRRVAGETDAVPGRRALRVGYAATALSFALLLALAEVLAHG